MSAGRVYLVGAGPGDPGLITVRGSELLSRADVIVYDRLVSQRLLRLARPEAELIYVGKRPEAHAIGQDEINELLVSRARGGAEVVRLKGGDPFVFGRGGEEALALAEAGIGFEVVPGITAGVAAPAYAGIPVTHRGLSRNLGLIAGHETPDGQGPAPDYHALAGWNGTLEFYMGVSNLRAICEALTDHGLSGDTPAAVVRWGTTPRQQVVTGTVRSLPALADEAGIEPPAMVVIGRVVDLRAKLRWFELLPLFGRRIVVTRARAQAWSMTSRLERLGAEVVEMPAIRIVPAADPRPLRRAVANLDAFDWVVFTSVNAVDAFFAALHEARLDSRALRSNKICAIGPVTAERLGRFGLRPDVQPTRFATDEIVPALASLVDLAGARILCPRSEAAPGDLVEALGARKAAVQEVVAYRSVPDCSGAESVAKLLERDEIHWITFTSASTVRNFFQAVRPEAVRGRGARLASIGPATSAALGEFGLAPAAQADTHTIDGLIDAILEGEKAGGASS